MCKYIIIFVFLSCCSSAWSHHVESISPRNLSYGYSPFYDNKTNSCYFVDFDLVSQCLFRYDLNQKILYGASIDAGYNNPSFLIPLKCCKNKFVVSIDLTLMIIEWDGISPTAKYIRNATAVERDPIYNNHFDRGKVDPKGRLYAGTYRKDYCPASHSPNGSLYLFEKNKNIQTLVSNIRSLTGLAFNKKKKLFYFIDYCTNYISEFDWSPCTGQINNWRKVFTFPAYLNQKYVINGLDIDACGNLYVGLYNGSAILKINPRSGVVERMIHVPVETITGFTFVGPNLDELIVTTSTTLIDFTEPPADSYPLAPSPWRGQVLMITGLGIKGAGAGMRLSNYL